MKRSRVWGEGEGKGKGGKRRTYTINMIPPIPPQLRHKFHSPRKVPRHPQVPVIGPIYLGRTVDPVLDVSCVVEGEAAFGEGGARIEVGVDCGWGCGVDFGSGLNYRLREKRERGS